MFTPVLCIACGTDHAGQCGVRDGDADAHKVLLADAALSNRIQQAGHLERDGVEVSHAPVVLLVTTYVVQELQDMPSS